MSNLKQRREAEKAIRPTSNGKKPKSAASLAAAERKAERRRKKLLNNATTRSEEADAALKRKRKAKRAADRAEFKQLCARLKNMMERDATQAELSVVTDRIAELAPKPLPPEPTVFAWFDWARETGNIIHAGRRKNKYRFPTLRDKTGHQRGAEIVAMSQDGRKLVKLPLRLALDVFGKA